LILCGLWLYILCGCAARAVQPLKVGPTAADKRVLIAAESSEYKDAVVDAVVDGLQKYPMVIRVIDISQLDAAISTGYDAVVVFNTRMAWRMNRRVDDFLQQAEQKERIILFSMAADPEWGPELTGVDAITAASNPDRSGRAAEDIIERVHRLLGGYT
jgi:hypothetical protein